jgi:hypothetical protein
MQSFRPSELATTDREAGMLIEIQAYAEVLAVLVQRAGGSISLTPGELLAARSSSSTLAFTGEWSGPLRVEMEDRVADGPGLLVMPRVAGKAFRCQCGANVFRKIGDSEYACNACGEKYLGIG